MNKNFVAVWSDHPRWSKTPRDPAIWKESHEWDSQTILWMVAPDKKWRVKFNYNKFKTPEQLREAMEDAMKKYRKGRSEKKL